jgi:DNA-binding transcriptional ArsR family regulator
LGKESRLTRKRKLTYYFAVRTAHHQLRRTRQRGAGVFAAVGDETRRAVLDLLARGELAAGEIAAPFAMSRPAVSQHLGILRKAGLVSVRKAGRECLYRIQPQPLRAVYDWVSHYERFWTEKLSNLGAFLDKQP